MQYRNVQQLAAALGETESRVRQALRQTGLRPHKYGAGNRAFNDVDVRVLRQFLKGEGRTHPPASATAETR